MVSNWPDDADGDVLRRIESSGFDFDKPCVIDFNVDFDAWPPSPSAIETLKRKFQSTKSYELPEGGGYMQFQLVERLSYDLVMRVQSEVSDLMAPYGGVCESWGVLH